MAQQKQKQKGQHGGPRPKVRPDDRRGWNAVGGEHPHFESYEPNDADREAIKANAVAEFDDGNLASLLGISRETMLKYYGQVIRLARIKANMRNSATLFERAMVKKEPWAIKWWDQTRTKSSTRVEVTGKGGGPIETRDLSVLSDDELSDLQRILGRLAGMGDGESAPGA